MPRGCKPQGEQALSNAERQGRFRARHQVSTAKALTRLRRPIDAVVPSGGTPRSICCLLYRPTMPTGLPHYQTAFKAARQQTRWKPSSISTCHSSLTSSRHPATGVIEQSRPTGPRKAA